MFNLKKHTLLCRKKADKKRKSDNTRKLPKLAY